MKVVQSCPTLGDPMVFTVHRISPGQNTGVGSLSLLQGDLPNLGIEPRSPVLQVDFLPSEPRGKPRYILAFLIVSVILNFDRVLAGANDRNNHRKPFCSEAGRKSPLRWQHQHHCFSLTQWVAWAHGLRVWIKAPVSLGAWIQIPLPSLLFLYHGKKYII